MSIKLFPTPCAFRNSIAHRPIAPPSQLRRPFFSLPDLPNLIKSATNSSSGGGSGGGEEHYQEERVMPYTPRELYNVVANVPSYNQFLPFCTSSQILHNASINAEKPFEVEAELKVGFMGFSEGYVSKVKGTPFQAVEAEASSTPLFKTLVTTWRFHPPARVHSSSPSSSSSSSSNLAEEDDTPSPSDTAPTMVTLDLRYSFANPAHAIASKAFFGGVSGMMVKAFERRCQDLYGRRDRMY